MIKTTAATSWKKSSAPKHVRVSLFFAALILSSTAPRAIDLQAGNIGSKPGKVFRECPDCPEMVVIPAGSFTMGSPSPEKVWAAHHGASVEAVSDEAPQHTVNVRAFAMSKYDVTRSEYAAFVRETSYPLGDGCGKDSFKWNKQRNLNWKNPGFNQSNRDPVVCVSWDDAQAYVSWLTANYTVMLQALAPDSIDCQAKLNGSTPRALEQQLGFGGVTTMALPLITPGSKTIPMVIRILSEAKT
jgi:formylglycine-generating enzyme required for sulfatase activity